MQSFVDFVQFTVTAKPRPGQHLPTLSKRFGKDLEGLVLKVYTQIPNNVKTKNKLTLYLIERIL